MIRLDLSNETFKIGANNNPPYVAIHSNEDDKSYWLKGGHEYTLLKIWAKYFNFSYTLTYCHEDYGALMDNGHFSGLMGNLSANQVDLGISGITITYERAKQIGFLFPYYIDQFTFSTKAPKFKNRIDLLLRPFNEMVWLGLLACIMLLLLFSLINKSFSIHKEQQQSRVIGGNKKGEPILLVSLRILSRQSYDSLNNINLSMKLCLALLMAMGVVLTNSYSGCLFSLMAVPHYDFIRTTNELLEAVKSKSIYLHNPKFTTDAFENSNVPLFRELANLTTEKYNRSTSFHLMVSPNSKPIAVIGAYTRLIIQQLIYGEDLIYVPSLSEYSTFFPSIFATATRPNFPYRKEFNRVLMNILSLGLVDRWRHWEIEKLRKHGKENRQNVRKLVGLDDRTKQHQWDETYFKTLTMNRIAIVFYLYLACIVLAIAIFTMEIILGKHKPKYHRSP